MCQNCFQGEKIDYENLRTPSQQQAMNKMYLPMLTGLQMGATQYPGQMSAPMTDMQKMAAKTMSGVGGYGWEQQSPKYKSVPPTTVPNLLSLAENIEEDKTGSGVSIPKGGPDPYMPGPTPPGPPGPGPGPGPRPEPDDPRKKAEMDAMMQAMLAQMFGMGGSPYDPRNMMG